MIQGTNQQGVFNPISVVRLDQKGSSQHRTNFLSQPFISIAFPSLSPRKKTDHRLTYDDLSLLKSKIIVLTFANDKNHMAFVLCFSRFPLYTPPKSA